MPLSTRSDFSRRGLLIGGTKLSLASFALIAGLRPVRAATDNPVSPQDVDILNEILGTEQEGIAAYQICLDGYLLHKATTKTAKLFQDHHKTHRDLLTAHITALGGTPATAKALDEYKDDLNMASIRSPKDALGLIVKLERGAANGYIGMIPSTNDHELTKIAARIAADEVLHYTTLAALLGMPLPAEALWFGA